MSDSRERVLQAIGLEKPDRVPFSFSANAGTTERLLRDWKLSSRRELIERVGSDLVEVRGLVDPVWKGPFPQLRSWPGGITENHWGMRTRVVQTATGPEECYCDFALAGCDTIEQLRAHAWPSVDWFDFGGLERRLAEWSGYALMLSGTSVWQHASYLRGLDRLLMDMAAEPELAGWLLDRFTDFYLEYFDRYLSAARGRIDILRIVDDLAMQDRLLFGRDTFRLHVAPRIARFVALARSHGAKVMFHSCGAVGPLIEDLIALGVDVLDPVQVSAAGMDAAGLKARFGSRICFHGGIDTQRLLPLGSPAEVAASVQRMIETLGPAGYICAPSHTLQTDVPTANIAVLYSVPRLSANR